MSPEEVTELSWTDAHRLTEPTQLMREVLRQTPRHLRLPYVFWEHAAENVHAPLIGLRDGVEAAFNQRFESLAQAYASIVMIDRRKDAEHFMGLVEEIKNGDL
jgi:hypothetical protein